MNKILDKSNWQTYVETNIPIIKVILSEIGYSLYKNQPHIKGERFLMQAITTTAGKKIILLGENRDGEKVVIKATSDNAGKLELEHERKRRKSLHEINFAYDVFHSPEELEYIKKNNFTILVQKYIEQECSFLERPIEEQFLYCLKAFKAQEKTRATTYNHLKSIKHAFGVRYSQDYLKLFSSFRNFIDSNSANKKTVELINQAQNHLQKNSTRVEQYCGFLTHTDFVPHNIRINDNNIYLLDFSSLQFGNKHDGWARFLNFMTLYNPELESLLIKYVENNQAFEERESLQLMRIFRLGEIVTYYLKTIKQSEGDLLSLNSLRVDFWTNVLAAELKNTRVSQELVATYKNKRDGLRSQDEKQRQIGLH